MPRQMRCQGRSGVVSCHFHPGVSPFKWHFLRSGGRAVMTICIRQLPRLEDDFVLYDQL